MYCLPARASLLTGLHDGHSNGWKKVKAGIYTEYGKGKLSLEEATEKVNKSHLPTHESELFLAEVMKKAGYHTGQFGKLEWGFATTADRLKRHGWDFHYGYYDHLRGHGYYPSFLWKNGERVDLKGNPSIDGKTQGTQYSQSLFIEEILTYIREHKGEPFFLYHPTQIIHAIMQIPEIHPLYKDDSKLTEEQKICASMVTMLDDHVGLIRAELEKQGILEKTLILFSADNGHTLTYERARALGRKNPFTGKGFDNIKNRFETDKHGDVFNGNDGMAGIKFTNWEGGIRVPLIAMWKGKIKPGSTSELLVANYDLMPTLGELVGVEIPAGKDGVSYLPTLLGNDAGQKPRDYVYASDAIVTSDGWKLRSYKSNKNKKDLGFQLYNLNEDYKEEHDLAQSNPERLKELLQFFEKEYDSERRDVTEK